MEQADGKRKFARETDRVVTGGIELLADVMRFEAQAACVSEQALARDSRSFVLLCYAFANATAFAPSKIRSSLRLLLLRFGCVWRIRNEVDDGFVWRDGLAD